MESKKILIKIGKRIEMYRKETGLSRQVLADKCDVNRTTIYRIEKGELNFNFDLIFKIARVLEIELEYIFKK